MSKRNTYITAHTCGRSTCTYGSSRKYITYYPWYYRTGIGCSSKRISTHCRRCRSYDKGRGYRLAVVAVSNFTHPIANAMYTRWCIRCYYQASACCAGYPRWQTAKGYRYRIYTWAGYPSQSDIRYYTAGSAARSVIGHLQYRWGNNKRSLYKVYHCRFSSNITKSTCCCKGYRYTTYVAQATCIGVSSCYCSSYITVSICSRSLCYPVSHCSCSSCRCT